MKTVIVTDGKYRSSLAAVRSLHDAGWQVCVTQTRSDVRATPPVFLSKCVDRTCWIDGSVTDAEYPERLLEVLREWEHPVLLCIGAVTLNTVAKHKALREACDCLVAEPEVLDRLNDKELVHRRCTELGIPVPRQYAGEPESYPVIVKPHCGEKFGLKAADRYAVCGNAGEYHAAMERLGRYDPQPLVQEKVSGAGAGVSLLMDRSGALLCALCHRRLREYPISGGPSTCCETFYDAQMIEQAHRLLKSFGFCGLAMVEFKGDRVLEVNPRVWGSFPMTWHAKSPICDSYARAAAGEVLSYQPRDYALGVRMRFLLNDTFAILSYLRAGRFREAFGSWFAAEALRCRGDQRPFYHYLKTAWREH